MKKLRKIKMKPAKKILIIGGSTFNQNTPKKITKALMDSKFLDEWAVIIAIHQYFQLRGFNKNDRTLIPPDHFKSKIKLDFSLSEFEPQISFISSPGKFTVKTGCIYVLPDPGLDIPGQPINKEYLSTSFIGDKYQLKIHAEISGKSVETWFINNPFDASATKRKMTARDLGDIDDTSLHNLPLPTGSNISQLKAIAQKSSPETVMYKDMPCIDKFMSEVAASKSKPTIAALLLCGLFGDGANGLQAIQNIGGYTAVQFPDECCREELGIDKYNTSSIPNTALKIEPKHQIVTLEGKPNYLTLFDWLCNIKSSNL
ncbi:MAG: chemotaxis protein CheB [Cuspidothrix sp.]